MTITTATIDLLTTGAPAAPEELALARDQAGSVWSGRGGRAVEILVVEGEVWVTFEGDPEDRVLAAGQRFAPDRPGRVAFLALRPSRIAVRRAARRAA